MRSGTTERLFRVEHNREMSSKRFFQLSPKLDHAAESINFSLLKIPSEERDDSSNNDHLDSTVFTAGAIPIFRFMCIVCMLPFFSGNEIRATCKTRTVS